MDLLTITKILAETNILIIKNQFNSRDRKYICRKNKINREM